MRKLLTFLIALAAVAFLNVSAHAFGCKGWPQLSGGNGCNSSIAAAGGGTPTLAYIGIVTPTYSSGVATATGAAIGTAAADRLVVVVFFDETATNTSLSSVTTDSSFDADFGSNSGGVGHATGIATNAASTVSDTFTGDSGVNHLAIAAVSWR
jgi:hypothetical protein